MSQIPGDKRDNQDYSGINMDDPDLDRRTAQEEMGTGNELFSYNEQQTGSFVWGQFPA